MTEKMSDKGFTVWFTGLSGSGKTTIAWLLADELKKRGKKVEVIDGEVIRQKLSPGLGFSPEERNVNVQRIGFVCHLLSRNGIVAIAAAISPNRAAREENRKLIGDFIEIFTRCPIELLIKKDYKGLYKKALSGEFKNLTGVNDPYEEPEHPELILDTDKLTPEEATQVVLNKIEELGYLMPEKTISGYTPDEEEKVNERLKALGYL